MKRRTFKAANARKKTLNAVIRKEGEALHQLSDQLEEAFLQDGKVDIHVDLAETELYNPVSFGAYRLMNSEIFDYIDDTAKMLPSLIPLRLILHHAPRDDEARIREMIDRHYRIELQQRLLEKRANWYKMIFMLIFGLLVLGVYLFLAFGRDDSLELEILSVIASFSLWEAANCFMEDRRNISLSLLETARFMTMEIAFEDE